MIRFGLLAALMTLVLDQLSKVWAQQVLVNRGIEIMPGYFDLTLVHNLGAAFGMFTNLAPFWRQFLLVGVAVVACIMILMMLRSAQTRYSAAALGMIMGGAMGNLLDRVRLGWVVDFIHLHWQTLSWPVFNIADTAITIGVAMILLEGFGVGVPRSKSTL
ncbi:signal peptidase II, Aspartic peptidase, MEROPS family A08 [Magnetococcus marinus MC-1]|uniref:Lipoprotein signal peptidase n=1 Tax=Magnetococcus marinus (strain ATCC BAA-1437 / JCM 17883 / MC-1) TaxID=156889 RepID=A0L9K4_MAGMM|nr:signal peptidase II [Magnetococcus marinus]ABK44647.1 signal peptidase II, Aspartic peptidase, MEROPS family A08 [Magnetococcus marinus MC-1]